MRAYFVAGEKSGDLHASLVMKELLALDANSTFFGLGGIEMHKISPNIQDWAEEAGVMGIVEVLKRFSFFKKKFHEAITQILEIQPDALVLIDYPGFNLRLAKRIHELAPNTKIIYYISPQVWAWHKGRIPKMAKFLDLMLCIFPFEKQCYENSGLRCEYVGHPLAQEIQQRKNTPTREENLIALLPGSREREISRLFPTMLRAAEELLKDHPNWKFEVPAASQKLRRRLESMRANTSIPPEKLIIECGNFNSLLDRATCGIVASGTASLEAALHGLPYTLVYALNPLTYWFARCVVKIPHAGMVNILAGREVVRELIQHNFTKEALISEIQNFMNSQEKRDSLRNEMMQATGLLDGGNAAQKVATHIIKEIQKN